MHARLITVLVIACLLLVTPTQAQQRYCLPEEPRIAALCGALESPDQGFEAPRLLQQAVDLIAQVVTAQAEKAPQDMLAGSIDDKIISYLDKHRSELDARGADYCEALAGEADKKRFSPTVLATACLRPVCLIPPLNKGPPPQCAAISASDAPVLLGYARVAGNKVFKQPCDQRQPDCQYVASDAAELVVLVDELQPFFRAAFQNGKVGRCTSPTVCTEALADYIRRGLHTLAEGAALDLVLSSDASLAAQLDPSGTFHVAWSNLQQQQKDFSKPQTDRIFPWDVGLFTALGALEPKLDAVVGRSADYLKQAYHEKLTAIWKRGEGLLQVVEHNPALKSNPTIKAFSEAWAASVRNRLGADVDVTGIESAADNIRQLQDQLKQAEAELKKQVEEHTVSLVVGGNTDGVVRCSPGESTVDWVLGTLDFCFADAPQKMWLSGLRFAFAPCGPGVHSCVTTGDIRVLLPVNGASANPSWVATPTGIGSVPARVTKAGVTIMSLPPARPLSRTPEEVSAWLQQMLPPPLRAIDYGKVEVKDGPEIQLSGLHIAIPSVGLPNLEIPAVTLSRTGLSAHGGILRGETDFEAAVREVLSSVTKNQMQIAGLQVSSAHLLEDKEHCGAVDYRMREYPYGFCVTTRLGLASLSEPLKMAVLLDKGANIALRLGFEPGSIAPQINRALSSTLGQAFDLEAITADDQGLNLSLQGPGTPPCAFELRLNWSDSSVQAQHLVPKDSKCQAGNLLPEGPLHAFNLLGLDFSDIRSDRVCLPGGQGVCIVGPTVSQGGLHVDFSHARLDDGGRLNRFIADQLADILPTIPAAISTLEIRGRYLVVEAEWDLPGFDTPIRVSIQLGGENAVNVDVKSTVGKQIADQLKGRSAAWGALKMTITDANTKGSNELWVHGKVSFDTLAAMPVDVQLLPSFHVQVPSVQSMVAQIFNAAMKWGQRGDAAPQVLVGPDYSLRLRVPILATVPVGGFDGIHVSAMLEASVGKPFQFAGPVTVSLPIWIPTGPEIDIGDLQAMVDLSSSDFGIGASVALTPGAATHDLLAFKGMLSIQRADNTVRLAGDLDALQTPLSTVQGVWQTREGILRIDSKATASAVLPFPQVSITLTGLAALSWARPARNS